ncbi:hypothetical protein [Kutzneria kofuensis]|uniref:Uncharacterized protein n=1 Tax=Kutzneria kofuensis TaxID=103725 RepID=A0A7W9KNJ1_9PSEU|nr:hypothetical protein [Kutzneria kofuensis]MBB5895845.1 hypothetical protein [Kutzneria kofuensis]
MRENLSPIEDDAVKAAMSELSEMSDDAFVAGREKLLARMGKTAEPPASTGAPARSCPPTGTASRPARS